MRLPMFDSQLVKNTLSAIGLIPLLVLVGQINDLLDASLTDDLAGFATGKHRDVHGAVLHVGGVFV